MRNAKIAILFPKIRVSRGGWDGKVSRGKAQRRLRNRGFSICLQNSSFFAKRYGVDMECLPLHNGEFTQCLLCCMHPSFYCLKRMENGQKMKIVAVIAHHRSASHVSNSDEIAVVA